MDNHNKNEAEKYFLIAALISAISFEVAYFYLSINGQFQSKDTVVSLSDFLASAQWVQAIAVIVTAVFGYLIHEQLSLTKEQLRFQRQMSMAENYKNVASNKYRVIRSFIFRNEMEELFAFINKQIEGFSKECLMPESHSKVFNTYLSEIKDKYEEIRRKATKVDKKGCSLDNLEMLLNEYNNFGRLVTIGGLESVDILPEQAIDNANKFLDKVRPYIEFRRLGPGQAKYAKGYTDWIEKEKERKLKENMGKNKNGK